MKTSTKAEKNSSLVRAATDSSIMSGRFEYFFRQEYPALGLQVTNCRVGPIYNKPGKSCKVTYFLAGQDKHKQTYQNWFHATISSSHLDPHLGKKHSDTHPGCGFWKPVMLWPEMNMVLHTFPYDPRMPYLGQLLEPDIVRQTIQKNMTGFGLTDAWRCEQVICTRVKHRPGKSCTLRYEAEMRSADGSKRQFRFFGKTYRTSVSRHIFEVLQQIFESSSVGSGALNIPKPIAHIEEANTVWQHAWEGQNISHIGKNGNWQILTDSNLVERIAFMLAELHVIEITNCPLRPAASIETVLQNAAEDSVKIVRFLQDKEQQLREVMEKIAASVATRNEQIPPKTIHGTFKLAQILCNPDKLALVDFDSIALGDPIYDVAEFLASLEYLKVTQRVDSVLIDRSISSFVSGYQSRVSWPCDSRRLAFYMVPFLLGKIHSSLKKMESGATDGISTALGLVEKWAGEL